MRVLLTLWGSAAALILCVVWLVHHPIHGQSMSLDARLIQGSTKPIIGRQHEQAR